MKVKDLIERLKLVDGEFEVVCFDCWGGIGKADGVKSTRLCSDEGEDWIDDDPKSKKPHNAVMLT